MGRELRIWAEAHPDARRGAKAVLVALAGLGRDDTGLVTLQPQDVLAERAGMTTRSVRDAIKRLVAAGVVEIVQPGNGRGHRTVYRLLAPWVSKEEETSAFTPSQAEGKGGRNILLLNPEKAEETSRKAEVTSHKGGSFFRRHIGSTVNTRSNTRARTHAHVRARGTTTPASGWCDTHQRPESCCWRCIAEITPSRPPANLLEAAGLRRPPDPPTGQPPAPHNHPDAPPALAQGASA